MKMINGKIFRGGAFHEEELFVADGRIVARPEASDEDVLDVRGLYILPGLTDLHFHGAISFDLCDAGLASLRKIQQFEARRGVTQICPATMTVSAEELRQVFAVAGQAVREGDPEDGAWLCGIHMEGPYISAGKLGAQNPQHLAAASWEQLCEFQKLSGNLIRIVSMAPEEEGAMAFIDKAGQEMIVSLAHTTAGYEIASEAYRRGARHATHLFNAMPPLHHRDPGVVGAAFDCKDASVELICDGVHIHPSVIRMVFRLFEGRVCLISDSMRATGLEDGDYDLGGQKVTVRGNVAQIANGSIAGSVTTLLDCLRYAVGCGVPLEAAVAAATETPARVLRIDGEAGVIEPGRRANLIFLDENLHLRAVYLNGRALER